MNDLISRKEAIDALGKEGLITAMVIIDRVPSVQPVARDMNVLSKDLIIRQVAIDQLHQSYNLLDAERRLEDMPSAQPTLYGYNVEHLAYIARVMEKEGVTAEYAVRTFDDMGRAIKMIMEEAREKVEEALNEQFNRSSGGD